MKKKYFMILFVLSNMFASAQTSVWDGRREVWSNGAGTENNPYLIESADNMAFLAYMVNKGYETKDLFFRLTVDIDLGGEDQPWEPIGLGDRWANEDGCDRGMLESGSSFRGNFDGGGHSVFNLHVEDGFTNAGLFGVVVGQNYAPAVIENVFVVSGSVLGGNCGGVVGNGNFVQVNRCWNGASIEGAWAGGIMGLVDDVAINNCYNVGNILGVGDNAVAGGLVGFAQSDVQLSNSYNAGDIFGVNHIGCLVGDSENGTMTVENCHYLNTCSQSEFGMLQDEAFMQSMEFVYLLNGQDEEPVWAFDMNGNNNGFPILAAEVYSVETEAIPSVGGIVTGGGCYAYGMTCTIIATANIGYHFVDWTENDTAVSNETTYSFAVTEDRALMANFEINSYEITSSAIPAEGGTITGAGTYNHGETATLTATANTGYHFVNWTENGLIVSEETSFSIVVTESRNIVANLMYYDNVGEVTEGVFLVYPNPVDDVLVIESLSEISNCEIFNQVGQRVYCETNYHQKMEINTKGLPSGIYIIKIVSGGKACTRKFVRR